MTDERHDRPTDLARRPSGRQPRRDGHRGARPGVRRAGRKRERGERPLLEVKGLRTSFHTRDGVVRAVDGIDFHVDRGEIMGLVGESGCGKSVTQPLDHAARRASPGRIEAGEVLFDGTDLLKLEPTRCASIRGDRICMIFQQPQSSLNPVWDVGAPDRRGPRDPPRA